MQPLGLDLNLNRHCAAVVAPFAAALGQQAGGVLERGVSPAPSLDTPV